MLRSLLDPAERRARLARDGGWSGLLRRELAIRRRRIYVKVRMTFLVDDLERPLPRLAVPEGVRLERHLGGRWESFRGLAGPRQRKKYARRLVAGRVLLAAWRGDEVVGVTWITGRAEMELDGMVLDLPAGWAYAYGLLVRGDARRGGIGSALTNARAHLARELGYRRVCRVIRVRNVAAWRAAAKAQASTEPAGEVVMYQLFGHKWVRWTHRP